MSEWKTKVKPKLDAYLASPSSVSFGKMSKALGISKTTFENYAYGDTVPSYDNGVKIIKYLKKHYDEPQKDTYYKQLMREGKIR